MQASYPAIGAAKKSLLEALTEVHLRRLDTHDTLHRRAVAVIAVEASPEEVHAMPCISQDSGLIHSRRCMNIQTAGSS